MTPKLITGLVFFYASLAVAGDDKVVHAVNLELTNPTTSFYTLMKSATLTANRQLIFPDSAGTAGYVLSTNGAGVLSWIAGSGLAIGNPVSGGTSGSILFVDGGTLAQNNSKLFWDNATFSLGVGTATPLAPFHVNAAGNVVNAVIEGHSAGNARSLRFYQGGPGNQYLQFANSPISAVMPGGVDANGFNLGRDRVSIIGADSPVVNSTITARLEVKGETSDATTKALQVEKFDSSVILSVLDDGKIGVGTATPVVPLDVVGAVQITDAGGNGGNVPHVQNLETVTAASGACTVTCSTGRKALGGGCSHSAALALHTSYPSASNTWSCDYLAYTSGTCTVTAICLNY